MFWEKGSLFRNVAEVEELDVGVDFDGEGEEGGGACGLEEAKGGRSVLFKVDRTRQTKGLELLECTHLMQREAYSPSRVDGEPTRGRDVEFERPPSLALLV